MNIKIKKLIINFKNFFLNFKLIRYKNIRRKIIVLNGFKSGAKIFEK